MRKLWNHFIGTQFRGWTTLNMFVDTRVSGFQIICNITNVNKYFVRILSLVQQPGASRQFVAGRSGWTGTNHEGIWVHSYYPGSATDPNRFGAKSDHSLSRLCYSLRRFIPSVAPEALRCIPVRTDRPRLCPGHWRQRPCVTMVSHGSMTAKPQCYTVAYEYIIKFPWNLQEICQNSSYIPRQKRTAIRVGEKIGNGVRN